MDTHIGVRFMTSRVHCFVGGLSKKKADSNYCVHFFTLSKVESSDRKGLLKVNSQNGGMRCKIENLGNEFYLTALKFYSTEIFENEAFR